MKTTLPQRLTTLFLLSALALPTIAADKAADKTARDMVAKVNGVTIGTTEFNRVLEVAKARGKTDTPALRTAIRDELVLRELLNQEAKRTGLDKGAATQVDLDVARATVLLDSLLAAELTSQPLTEDELRQEYDRQTQLLGSTKAVDQWQLSQITVNTEAQAQAVLARLKGGADFATVARDSSIDASRAQGGSIGWVVPPQVLPAIGEAVAPLAKGTYTATPVHVGDLWHVIRVDDRRPMPIPNFDDARPQLASAVIQARRLRLLDRLVKGANVTLAP